MYKQIRLLVVHNREHRYGGQPGPGLRVIWSDELAPEGSLTVHAGTHSGISTTVREVAAGDQYSPVPGGGDAELIQYEATYKLLDVPAAGIQAGQITARGAFFFHVVNNKIEPVDPVFAITGGTGPYRYARGEGHQEDKLRILDLDM